MAKYITKQRRLLLDFLAKHTDETLSAGQIAEALSGKEISTSAIYRNLAALEQEGKLKRSVKPGSQEAYYRYTDDEDCRGHLHLSCLRCGKMFPCCVKAFSISVVAPIMTSPLMAGM